MFIKKILLLCMLAGKTIIMVQIDQVKLTDVITSDTKTLTKQLKELKKAVNNTKNKIEQFEEEIEEYKATIQKNKSNKIVAKAQEEMQDLQSKLEAARNNQRNKEQVALQTQIALLKDKKTIDQTACRVLVYDLDYYNDSNEFYPIISKLNYYQDFTSSKTQNIIIDLLDNDDELETEEIAVKQNDNGYVIDCSKMKNKEIWIRAGTGISITKDSDKCKFTVGDNEFYTAKQKKQAYDATSSADLIKLLEEYKQDDNSQANAYKYRGNSQWNQCVYTKVLSKDEKGRIGELCTDLLFLRHGWKKKNVHNKSNHGIDGLFIDTPKIDDATFAFITESKMHTRSLSAKAADSILYDAGVENKINAKGSDSRIIKALNKLYKRGDAYMLLQNIRTENGCCDTVYTRRAVKQLSLNKALQKLATEYKKFTLEDFDKLALAFAAVRKAQADKNDVYQQYEAAIKKQEKVNTKKKPVSSSDSETESDSDSN